MKLRLPLSVRSGFSSACRADVFRAARTAPVMKLSLLLFGLLLAMLAAAIPAAAQFQPSAVAASADTVKIMDYNLLNYPGSTASIRDPHFRAVVHSSKPDVLVALEMTSQAGVTTFLNDVLNYYQAGLYSTIAFNDGPDTDPHIFYKPSKVTFIGASYFPMSDGLRNIGLFKIRVNSSGDTLLLYAVHLKASTGFESQRLAEATALRDTLNRLPAGTKFMVMGDFNLYTSTEPAYGKLLESQADNDGRLKDPINMPGSWNNNGAFALIHTQSPRVRSFDGGSTGGMDDRFDFILTSYASLDSNTIVSSYIAYGNDGNHLNDSINHLPNAAVPDSVANGLHYASDHIPVICSFRFGTASSLGSFALASPANGAAAQPLAGSLSWGASSGATGYDVYLGSTNPPTTKVSSNQAGTSYSYSGLGYGTVYYWKVVARNAVDTLVAAGAPWSFTSIVAPPASFVMSSPSNGSADRPVSGTLSWGASANATGYDVYLGTANPPVTKVSANQAALSYSYSGLANNAVYYWKIVARNSTDTAVATGAPWSFTTIVAAPAAFALTAPSAGATNQAVAGTLSWQSSARATSYDVYLDTLAIPAAVVSSSQAGTSYGYSGLLNARTYYWKVVAKNAGGSTTATGAPWSFTTIVAAPAAFSQLSPGVGATGQAVTGTLSWQASANAANYDVYLDTNAAPTTLVSVGQAGTSYGYSGLLNAKTYYWKIVAKNAAGTLVASNAPLSFTTVIAAPAAFAQLAPSAGAVNQPLAGTLSWQVSTRATGYDVYLDTAANPTTLVSAGQPGTSLSYSGLQNAKTYYWKVVAKNAGGSTTATGAPWSFTTVVAAPGAFAQSAPANGSGNQPAAGTLSWQASAGAAAYDVYLDTAASPATIVSAGQAGTSYNYSGLANGKTYYWKIVATNAGGATAAAGSPWSFTTIVAAPAAFTQLAPASGALDQPVAGTLSWQPATRATAYDVYLDTTANPSTLVSADQAGTSYNYGGLVHAKTYRWKVVAKNIGGATAASNAPASFTTVQGPPEAFSLLAPSSGAFDRPLGGTLTWEAAANAAGYDVYLDTSANPATIVSAGQPGTSYAYAGLGLATTYYWKVVASNGSGNTVAAGSPRSFVTTIGAPGAFALLSPPETADNQSLSGTLTWSASPNATSYDVYLDTNAVPAMIVSGGQTDTAYHYTGLVRSTTYYWTVVAKTNGGATPASNGPWPFRTSAIFTIAASAGLHGAIAPSGAVFVNQGADQAFAVTPDPEYLLDSLIVDGVRTDSAASYTFHGVAADHTIRAVFAIRKYTLTSSAGPHGTIAPLGAVSVNSGASQVFLITPAPLYHTDSLLVDGVNVPDSAARYTFAGVAASHTIRAVFRIDTYTITASAGPHGAISPAGPVPVTAGTSQSFVFTPASGYHTDSTIVDGVNVPDSASGYTFTSLASSHTIRVAFALDTVLITASANAFGAIAPSGAVAVPWGSDATFTLTPAAACSLESLFVDGVNVPGAASPYTFHAVEADHTIRAVFVGTSSTLDLPVLNGWNLVSVPMLLEDGRRSAVFPSATSSAFAYQESYVTAETLAAGRGYWLKFSADAAVPVTGTPTPSATIAVAAGWNMVGSIATPVAVSAVTSVPPGVVTSGFFGYAKGYVPSSTIEPGKGYWVKVSQAASLMFSTGGATNPASRIRVISTSELPPPPPADAGRSGAGLPSEYALGNAFPSPFNPSTTINYQLPVDSRVTLRIYNVLGEIVATLVDADQAAGDRSATWNAGSEPSGVYFCRLEASGLGETGRHASQVTKLILMR